MDMITAAYAAEKLKADLVKKEREVFVPAEEYLFQDTGWDKNLSFFFYKVGF